MQAPPPPTGESEPVVLYEKKEHFARITLNRPDVLNAINQAVLRGLNEGLDQAEADDEVKAVIITGAGRAFSAGGDLTESSRRIVAGQEDAAAEEPPRLSAHEVYTKIWHLSKPVIAAVRGHAVGQGCEMTAVCDITIASEDARLGEPQIRHGFGLPMLIVPWLMGLKQSKELLLTGAIMDAHEAQRLGLVNRVVPNDKLDEEAENLARRIAALPQATVRADKALINRVFELMGILQSLNYQQQPAFADLAASASERSEETREHMRRLQEQGWEAFIQTRNQPFADKR
ncbi:MAG: enoyl-CoA hydratase/isomerase family protein [Chloroflexi bacterium]|nr:enoyl-CoA hydratase/isomerase family protein [Chloroflexota bacterium]